MDRRPPGVTRGLRRHLRRFPIRTLPKGIVLLTGERIASASARHILGEESSARSGRFACAISKVTRALDPADNGLMRCLERAAEDPRNEESRSFLLRQVQRGPVAKPPRGRPGSPRRAIERGASHCDPCAGEISGEISLLVHGVGVERDGRPRSQKGVELRGARTGMRRRRAVPSAVYGRRRHEWPRRCTVLNRFGGPSLVHAAFADCVLSTPPSAGSRPSAAFGRSTTTRRHDDTTLTVTSTNCIRRRCWRGSR